MKKRRIAFITVCILLINCFISNAAWFYPPGTDEPVEGIVTDSYPNVNSRVVNASGSWQHDATGWWWQYSDGSYAINKWECIDNHWYFFNSDGYMLVGWQNINSEWFYLEPHGNSTFPAGAMAKGWLNLNGFSYYLYLEKTGQNPMGSMAKGWINIGGEQFHLDETTGRRIEGEAITLGVNVYTDSTFRKEFSGVMTVDELFRIVGIPFEKTWNLLLDIDEYHSSGLSIDLCTQAASKLCSCVPDVNCSDSTNTEYHHKNSLKLVNELKNNYPAGYYLEVGLGGSKLMCRYNQKAHHTNYGITIDKQYTYCGTDKNNVSHTIRVIQHEMSHMFGCKDTHSQALCTMNGGFDAWPLYTENIWCQDCRNGIFIRSSHQGK